MSFPELTNERIQAEIETIIKYNAILENDLKVMRKDRSFQEKAHKAWLEHANASLEQQTRQTNIMENLLITLMGVLHQNK